MALKFRDLFKSRSDAKAEPAPATATEAPADEYARALQLQQENKLEQAVALFDQVLARQPGNAEAHYKRANACNRLEKWDAALAGYDRAVELDPNYAYAWCNRGTVLEKLRRWDEALGSYESALALIPDDALTHYNRSSVLKQLARREDALASYDRAIALQPRHADAFVNRGHLLQELNRHAEAVISYDRAIELNPVLPEAFMARATALQSLMRTEEALQSSRAAIVLKPDYADAHINQSNLLIRLHRYEEALESFDRAVAMRPDHAESHRTRGALLALLKRFDEALTSYERALALDPEQKYLMGMRQFARMQICNWEDLDTSIGQLAAGIAARRPVTVPLTMLGLVDSAPLHRVAAEVYAGLECPRNDSLGPLPAHVPGERIRIGYFSADFRVHPVSLLAAELFELHDRSRFEITAFAFGPKSDDPVRARLLRSFEHFIDINDRTDSDAALLARELRLDVAVDLTGYTQSARSGIFALRAAPVQVAYLGYPGTMAVDFMDYLIADQVIVPAGSEQHFSEKIIRLPNSYQPNDSQRPIGTRAFSRQELELPPEGFVFCCFNRNFKLMPAIFDCWMRILRRVDGSVLWLTEGNPSAVHRLREAAASRGVDPRRLVFAQPMPLMADHLARQRLAGLFLDTLPFNAHTTASDALWAGLPVLTCAGQTLASRVAASLLLAVGLPELVTSTLAEYEELAVRLATSPAELRLLHQKLDRNRASAALFDTARFARHLEDAYAQIYQRSQAGMAPDHIVVDA